MSRRRPRRRPDQVETFLHQAVENADEALWAYVRSVAEPEILEALLSAKEHAQDALETWEHRRQ